MFLGYSFKQIFASRSFTYLRAVFREYNEVKKKKVESVILFGDIDALIADLYLTL